MNELSNAAKNVNWLLNQFTDFTSGVSHAVVTSGDGHLMAMSRYGLSREGADRLAAVASGFISLARGTSHSFQTGEIKQTVVEMERGFMFVMSTPDGSIITALAFPGCDPHFVTYEMARMAERASAILTPEVRAELAEHMRTST